MREAEAKIRVDCSRFDELRGVLRGKGYRLEGRVREDDVYYQHPCRDLMRSDEALRLRYSGGRMVLSYKGPRSGGRLKVREELEARVEGPLGLILERLGFRESVRVGKSREVYRGDRVKVFLDTVDGVGCFIEVESLTGDPMHVSEALKELGLDKEEVVYESYAEIVARSLSLSDSDRPHTGD